MAGPPYSASDYARALLALLPRGRVWPRDPGTVISRLMASFGPTFERLTARANNLLVDAFPATAVELLPEWEATLGLPDPCAGPAPTLQQRQAQVLARFAQDGGQSQFYFIQFVGRLGYTIEIEQFAPFRAGHSRAGQPDGGVAWAFAWAVKAPSQTVTYFAVNDSAVGEPLASWGNTVLECELNTVKPSHTVIIFEYGS